MLRHSLSHLSTKYHTNRVCVCLGVQQLAGELSLKRHESTISKVSSVTDEFTNAKPYSSIPGPKGLSFISSIFKLPVFGHREEEVFKGLADSFVKYGPIFKLKIGNFSAVNIHDVDAVQRLHRQEGKYPRRVIIESWRYWRDEQGLKRGILTEDGHEWKRMRTLLDKQFLQPRHVAKYTDNFNGVVTDLIKTLKRIRETKGNGLTVPDIDKELFRWSLETVGTVLYETRFGGLSENRLPEIDKFIHALQNIFTSTEMVLYFPVKVNRIILPKWQKMHEEGWDVVYKTTRRLIDGKIAEIQKKLENGEDASGFLAYLISTNMSREEVYGNICDVMLGAVDTTSNTMQWTLHEISKRPDIQERLHKEVTSVVPSGCLPSYENLQEMPFLKATVKEVLRLYPLANVTSRVLNDDIVLCGYQIPADTTVIANTYLMGRDPKLFKDPLVFRPDRWLRSERSDNVESIHSFAWLPFGFGPRSCIGRRIAELEMHLLLARISMMFVLKPADEKPLKPALRSILVPERPVHLQFIDRKL